MEQVIQSHVFHSDALLWQVSSALWQHCDLKQTAQASLCHLRGRTLPSAPSPAQSKQPGHGRTLTDAALLFSLGNKELKKPSALTLLTPAAVLLSPASDSELPRFSAHSTSSARAPSRPTALTQGGPRLAACLKGSATAPLSGRGEHGTLRTAGGAAPARWGWWGNGNLPGACCNCSLARNALLEVQK